jgi:hypothetical protein
MPLPQVSDRIKELPGQALRAVFAGVGQLLLAADKVRTQLAAPPDEPAQPPAVPSPEPAAPPAAAPPAAAAPARATPAGSSVTPPEVTDPAESRWRSLDKTGNVRLLHDGDPDLSAPQTAAAPAEPAAAEPAPAEPAAAETAPAEPAAAEVAEPEPADLAIPTPAEPAVPTPAEVAEPAPAEPVPAEPILAAAPAPTEVTPTAEPAEPAAAAEAALPVAGYDQLSLASLRARLRVLDVTQVRTLLDYEQAHQNRADMVTMFERRIAKLEQGG